MMIMMIMIMMIIDHHHIMMMMIIMIMMIIGGCAWRLQCRRIEASVADEPRAGMHSKVHHHHRHHFHHHHRHHHRHLCLRHHQICAKVKVNLKLLVLVFNSFLVNSSTASHCQVLIFDNHYKNHGNDKNYHDK